MVSNLRETRRSLLLSLLLVVVLSKHEYCIRGLQQTPSYQLLLLLERPDSMIKKKNNFEWNLHSSTENFFLDQFREVCAELPGQHGGR